MITYRRGTPEDTEQIVALLSASGLFWPGAAATPYVAELGEPEGGPRRIVGVYFKCVCFHAEPLAIEPGHGVSVSEIAAVMRQDMEDLATELGQPIVIYAGIQNNERALAAAAKNGMKSTGLFLHEAIIAPRPQSQQAESSTEHQAPSIEAPPDA